jgi:small-conductance mechanosensitive channel
MHKLSALFGEFLELIDAKSIEAMTIIIIAAAAIFLAALWVSRILQQVIDRRLSRDSHDDEATIRTYKKTVGYIVMVPGILLAVHALGINLSTLFTTGGLFAVAAAFAMKDIAENYVSGVLLRLERTIRPGDVLETEGTMVRVKSIGFHATNVRAKDGKDLVIPNSHLVKTRVANYTYSDSVCRIEATVGVAYASDLKEVREVLEEVCSQLDWISSHHKPVVLLSGFGDSAVNFKIRVWIEDPWESPRRLSLLNNAIWWGLKKAGIEIAYPQLDMHFDEAFTKTAGLGRAHKEEEKNE